MATAPVAECLLPGPGRPTAGVIANFRDVSICVSVSTAGTQVSKSMFSLVLRPDSLDWTWTLLDLDAGSTDH